MNLIPNNPADKIQRPKKEQYIGDFYNGNKLNELSKKILSNFSTTANIYAHLDSKSKALSNAINIKKENEESTSSSSRNN